MSSALEQAGAVREPSEYATLSMDREITGLWTQRSPLRDADVPYLYGKFYSASRFDSLIDGLNREMTARLTSARRPGTSVYNNQTFPAINSFYKYNRIVNGVEVIRVMADGQDSNIYDATTGQQTIVFTKGAGAGKARFVGVNTALYFTDGVENKKWLQPGPWTAQTSTLTSQYAVGTLVIDSNGKLQYLAGMKVGTVTNVQLSGSIAIIQFSPTNFGITNGMQFSLSGLASVAHILNGEILIALTVVQQGSFFTVTANFATTEQFAPTPDTGTATTPDVGTIATTGGTQPTWATGLGGVTADGFSSWQNFGVPVFDWGPSPAPLAPNIFIPVSGIPLVVWQPNYFYPPSLGTVQLMDGNENIWSAVTSLATAPSGNTYPNFQPPNTITGNPAVVDGGLTWLVSYWFGSLTSGPILSGPQTWKAVTTPAIVSPGGSGGDVLVDSNGNLQMCTGGTAGVSHSGSTQPVWNQIINGGTTDGGLTWTCLGPFLALAFNGWQYGYAFQAVDGSWSTLSPLSLSTHGVISGVNLTGQYSASIQDVNVGIFRTADGQSTPLLLATFPNLTSGTTWNFFDDYPDIDLVAFLPGPQNEINNPPPLGMTAPIYHVGRICAIYKNTVIMSGGPDILVGNGNTGFQPSANFPIPEQPIRLFSGQSAAGPALFIWGTSNIWVIVGAGTLTSPFQQASLYMGDVGILGYDAITQIGTTNYALTSKRKCVSLDPGAGYTEVGFPIGDQFKNVTTGGGGKVPSGVPVGALYDPRTAFITWAEIESGDTAVYAADGAIGWFRYSPVASPESGYLWSPRAVIVGGTSAVQAIETSPGVTQLLIGPAAATTGPILFRDSTVTQDWNAGAYHSYPSYTVKGNIVLCQSGEVAEIAHIAIKSMAVGAKPEVGLLLGELNPTVNVPFDWLEVTSDDPPDLEPSETMYSDRYSALQNGVTPKCDNFQLAIDYGTQDAADETLTFSIYGAKHAERKQQ